MKYISDLSGILSQRLNWHKSRIDCFAQMLLALFTVRSINLSEIAVAMDVNKASIESRYKRIYRFFSLDLFRNYIIPAPYCKLQQLN